jgi:hypothetical protein
MPKTTTTITPKKQAVREYVVMLTANDGRVMLVGDAEGRPLTASAARRLTSRYQTSTFHFLDAFPMRIQPLCIDNVPIRGSK